MRVAQNPTVVRVETENGSHVEPPLDPEWSNLDKLRWHLAVVLHDVGVDPELIHVEPARSTSGGVPYESYSLHYAHSTFGGPSFHNMWNLINGIGIGLSLR